jgi:hypothetical protein
MEIKSKVLKDDMNVLIALEVLALQD